MAEKKRRFRLEHWHKIAALLMIYDIIVVNISYFLGLWLRFDCAITVIMNQYSHYLDRFVTFIPVSTLLCIAVFLVLKLYNSIWRFASYTELLRILMAVAINAVLHFAGLSLWFGVNAMPLSYYVIGLGFQLLFTLGIRFSYRLILLLRGRRKEVDTHASRKKVMLIGAGSAGQMILRDVNNEIHSNIKVVCIIDDNPNKWGRYIDGVPVVGGRKSIISAAKKYGVERILVAIPSASEDSIRQILNICKDTGCEIRNLPGVSHLVSGQVTMGDMKEVKIEDLLGRKPIRVNMDQIYKYISGKTILVTGGGGSIGSELCRQVAGQNPGHLIILDVYENNAYDIEQELKENYPDLHLTVLIGSVRDSRRLNSIFAQYRPQIVYHAAAHKHVPLMETSPCESIKNNVIGTYKTAYAAMVYGCERFVLISTDKAVNPTNIMGASKRLCEMVIQSFDRAIKDKKVDQMPMLFTHSVDEMSDLPTITGDGQYKTEFVAVRFGNVLGSNGSVIPLFKKQIAKGGPVKVTHPEIIRYFMTIPEAVSLVMQAGTYAAGGEIFVLDMGVPVKIDELARNLIKLSGYEPDVDIMVVYTGLRPGEKLYEEKLMAEEGLQRTENDLIHIGNPIPFDTQAFLRDLQELMDAAYENRQDICQIVARIVPTYHPEKGGAGKTDETFEKLRKEAVGV